MKLLAAALAALALSLPQGLSAQADLLAAQESFREALVQARAMKGDAYQCRGSACTVTTSRTNVCSDGVYGREDIRAWEAYQRRGGWSDDWRDPDRQGTTATGDVNPIRLAYVVVPRAHRELLHAQAKVCVLDTGRCIRAEVREIGPAFGELSVGAMMGLRLNAHPAEGRYYGRIQYTFYR